MNIDHKKIKITSIKHEVEEFHPLVEVLLRRIPGVIDIENTHGTSEMGADFVFSNLHPVLNHQEYVGVIVKIGKISQDFSDIERQIDECHVERTFRGGKNSIRIDEIWVVINATISNNAQKKIHEKYKSTKIQFIAIEKLIKLIDQYFPDYWMNTNLETGEYLSTLRNRNEEIDRQSSLIQVSNDSFYIDQDIYEYPRHEYRKVLKSKNKKVSLVNVIDEITKHKFVLIEGGVGSGKSKLLRHLINHFTIPDVFTKTKILPVYTTYKELSDTFNMNFEDLLNQKINQKLQEYIKHENATYLVLIDAFDEKNIDLEQQIDEITALLESTNKLPNIKTVLTSRYLSELDRSNLHENSIVRFNLAALSMTRTLEFVKKLCANLNFATRLIEDLKKSPLLREMPRSPIAAILLAKLINENPKDLPSSMTELYSQYTELILGRWEIDKGLETQKEYQAFDTIISEFAKYILDFEMPTISVAEAKDITANYLKDRNLDLNPSEVFEKLINRCEIISLDTQSKTINFKHRSFAEFFYAKMKAKPNTVFDIDDKVLTLYWMNAVFFYLGILKDTPELLTKLGNLETKNEGERWLKIINMANYMLAAYATPYNVISETTTKVFLEAADLYNDIINKKIDSAFASIPQMQLLHLIQYVMRSSYSFDFFKQALEDAALTIDDSGTPDKTKFYAMFFINATYIELGEKESFDFLLKKYADKLPMDINMAIQSESKDVSKKSDLMKKQDKRIKHLLRGNSPLKHEIKKLFETPIKLLAIKEVDE